LTTHDMTGTCLGGAQANFITLSGDGTRGRGVASCEVTALINPGTDFLFVRKVWRGGRRMKGERFKNSSKAVVRLRITHAKFPAPSGTHSHSIAALRRLRGAFHFAWAMAREIVKCQEQNLPFWT
jgi:hypothetical protein